MRRLIGLIFVLLLGIGVQSQNRLSLPYTCSFEDNENLSDWVMNAATPNAYDQWCMADACSSEGKKSMYISYNQGFQARYAEHPNTICVYRTFRFPVSNVTEQYDISFDWRNMGDIDKAQLRVWYGKSTQLAAKLALMSESSGTTMNTQQLNAFEDVSAGTNPKVLCNSDNWQTCYLRTKTIGANKDDEMVLMFVWINQTSDSAQAYRLSACIDNIQIASHRAPRPENVSAEMNCADSSVIVHWESPMSEFTIAYKSNLDTEWRRLTGITDKVATKGTGLEWSYELMDMTESIYEIKLWSVNKKDVSHIDTSACYTLRNVVNYCATSHCIEYMYLDAPTVKCTYGKYDQPYINQGVNPLHHAIMLDPTATDERTNNKLFTVPQGSVSSVRLGNWDVNAEAESITYQYTVDDERSVLLLNYAIVLEDPEHEKTHQPFFSLRVLDEKGNQLEGDCGVAEYYAGYGSGIWMEETYIEQKPMQVFSHKILWKNWTSVGFDLSSYKDKTIYIELMTKDCSEGAHFGYAYFTLDCVSGEIYTDNCSELDSVEALAPDGFDYEWRREWDSSLYSTERKIKVVASDLSPYSCKCMFKDKHDCYFTVQTRFIPQHAVAKFTHMVASKDCQNKIKLQNQSYVLTDDGEILAGEKPREYQWEITTASSQTYTSTMPNPIVDCNPNGDTLYVKLVAYMSNHSCGDTIRDTIFAPDIITKDSILDMHICQGRYVIVDGQILYKDTSFTFVRKNRYGCDSIGEFYLTVHPTDTMYVVDSTCSSHPYVFGEDTIRASCENRRHTFDNQYGCDSIVYLTLTVYPQPRPSIEPIGQVCADDDAVSICYSLRGESDKVSVLFSDVAQQRGWRNVITEDLSGCVSVPFSDTIRVGEYRPKVIFEGKGVCADDTVEVPFTLHYASSVMEQKWNDVIALLNARYNGGYTYTYYQWYRNGELLEGQNSSYLYLPDRMEAGDEYYVELTNQYGVTTTTCPITFLPREQAPKSAVRKQIVSGRLVIQVNEKTYDAQGFLISAVR